MNKTFAATVAALRSLTSRDDIATGIAGVALCAFSLSIFVGMFSGAM